MTHYPKITFLTRRSKYNYLRQIKDYGRLRFASLSDYRANEQRENRERFDEFEGAIKIDRPRSVKRLQLTFRDEAGARIGPIDHQLKGPIKWFDSSGFSHVLCFSIHKHALLDEENTIDFTTKTNDLDESVLLVHDIHMFVKKIDEFMRSQNIEFACGPVEYVSPDYEGKYDAFKKPKHLKHQREYRFAIRVDGQDAVEFTIPGIKETLEVFSGLKIKVSIE